MEKVDIPLEKAIEPAENASLPTMGEMIPETKSKYKRNIQFSESIDGCSQNSTSTYKEALSQPAPGLSHRQKMLWLQKHRTVGLWVQCDECDRWRYLPDVLDAYELPKKWYCRMNPDTSMSSCAAPESPLRVHEEEDLVHGQLAAGSLVWARLQGWPWWPAMVDDCPDAEQYYWLDGFSDIPTHYNVVFFDSADVTRAWVSPENLKPYHGQAKLRKKMIKNEKLNRRIKAAITQADEATRLSLKNRLTKYSFISRFKGNIIEPKKISRRVEKKYQKLLKRRYDLEFSSESDESDDEDRIDDKARKGVKRTAQKKNRQPKNDVPKKLSEKIRKAVESIPATIFDEGDTTIINSPSKILKESDSMAVQLGSVTHTISVNGSAGDKNEIIPDTEPQKENSDSINNDHVMCNSPKSDDFEFEE